VAQARGEWKADQSSLDVDKLVFIDENGTSTKMACQFSYGLICMHCNCVCCNAKCRDSRDFSPIRWRVMLPPEIWLLFCGVIVQHRKKPHFRPYMLISFIYPLTSATSSFL